MQAVILAGGFGTRLYPLTKDVPKPMVKIIGKPILEFIVMRLKECGITEMMFLVKHMAEQISDYFGTGEKWGVKIKYVIEDEPLGTAGAVKNAEKFITEDFLVVSGDVFSTIDYDPIIACHQKNKSALGTIVLTRVEDPSKFGLVEINEQNQVTHFIEKPKDIEPDANGGASTFLINTGIYVFKKEVLNYIPMGKYDFARDLFPKVIDKLYGEVTASYWNDIGTLDAYYKTNLRVIESRDKFEFLFE